MPIDPEDAECVLREMQEWDPVGVCARSLQECLRVQAEAFGYDDLEMPIIDKHLHNLEKHNYQAIARDLKVTVEEVYEAVKQIQKLESRPARNFTETDDKTIAITPDVYVIKDGDKFIVTRQRPRRAAALHQRERSRSSSSRTRRPRSSSARSSATRSG